MTHHVVRVYLRSGKKYRTLIVRQPPFPRAGDTLISVRGAEWEVLRTEAAGEPLRWKLRRKIAKRKRK